MLSFESYTLILKRSILGLGTPLTFSSIPGLKSTIFNFNSLILAVQLLILHWCVALNSMQ
uniref:Uncharacterized protein n=1 Tax=Anguilla anguilla TaxID=7936 RepID=A0A0E9W2T0_ANGAN